MSSVHFRIYKKTHNKQLTLRLSVKKGKGINPLVIKKELNAKTQRRIRRKDAT
jgi:hypothetical protein